ncbi:alpha/beta hydrolase [Alloalcanivorax gelatiniphagus]|uniref:Alpha/beta hydrolase n=2 Tax=Alloalcanivorax gelatiniphagus TaxID=1194167 RepID=A0ABY2XKL6_9GAMM|nr:alpha/beta hydrolase [Alloalcanivorax gelatiniphagus]TMW12591.1 alpha/beta hydrolase [Alloalcanivorax gelatiniphagus]
MSCTREQGGVAPSPSQRLIAATLRGTLKSLLSPAFQARAPVALQRRWLATVARATLPARGVPRHQTRFAGVPVEVVGEGPAATLLYLHGGGYVAGSPATHRAITTRLARALDATVMVVDYRLAPEHPSPAALDDVVAVYRALLDHGHRPERMAVAGDSAGGGLSLAFLQHVRDGGELPPPAAGVLLSPWLDLTLTQTPRRVPGEAMLSHDWLAFAANAYAGERRQRPEVSPLAGDLNGLPPLLIQCGGDEILGPDSERLATALEQADTEARYQLFADRWHVFQMHGGVLADADRALAHITDFLGARFQAGQREPRP